MSTMKRISQWLKKGEKFNHNSEKDAEKNVASGAMLTYPKNNRSFMWPISGVIDKHMYQHNENKADKIKDGITIKAKRDTTVVASSDGIVVLTKREDKVYGNYVVIKHGNHIVTYGNLEKITVKKGEKVTKESKIGEVGRSGMAKHPQLYFGM